MASGDADIVVFGQRVLAGGCGYSEANRIEAISIVNVSRVLFGAIDDTIVVEVPRPSVYIAC